jgi:hypothetical protein
MTFAADKQVGGNVGFVTEAAVKRIELAHSAYAHLCGLKRLSQLRQLSGAFRMLWPICAATRSLRRQGSVSRVVEMN